MDIVDTMDTAKSIASIVSDSDYSGVLFFHNLLHLYALAVRQAYRVMPSG